MIQQISNIRTDKQLSHDDLARISYASCFNLFHTTSMFNPWPFGIYFAIDYYWVKRISSDTYQYKQYWGTTGAGNSPKNMSKSSNSVVVTKTLNEIVAIHLGLVCNKDGEERLLLACYYRPTKAFNRAKLGFFLLNPNIAGNKFSYKMFITPKPGLFPIK